MPDTEKMTRILSYLSKYSRGSLDEIKEKAEVEGPVLLHLLWLGSMGFVNREETVSKHPVIDAQWTITPAGRSFLTYVETHRGVPEAAIPRMQILFVASGRIKDQLSALGFSSLQEAISDILGSAKREVLVCSPYLDQVVLPLMSKVPNQATVRILTQESEAPMLTRLVSLNPRIKIRSVKERSGGVQLYQVHAKFVCVDRRSVVVMSANINERSLYYNFELGILVEDDRVAHDVAQIFDSVYAEGREVPQATS